MAISEASYISVQGGLAADKALRPFLAPSFDPADFLNATLPSWAPASTQRLTNCASLSEQTQTLLSQLNAQLNRLSNTLTQLTDDILRSGSRLAYDVEVLRGDTTSLSDVLTHGLRHDIEKFVPGGLIAGNEGAVAAKRSPRDPSVNEEDNFVTSNKDSPDYIGKLHTLTLVRNRLEAVIKIFGDAIEWVIPPSEMSSSTSFASVVPPESGKGINELEIKGRAFAEKIHLELSDLLESDEPDAAGTVLDRIEALRALAEVWKGTVEEKTRLAFVDGLAQFVHGGDGTGTSARR